MTPSFKTFRQELIDFEEFETISEDGVRKYQTPKGNFPSMTTVLGKLSEGETWLDDWRKRIGREEADKITQESADRGEILHEYAEKYLLNQLQRSELRGQAKLLFNRLKPKLDDIEAVYGTEVAVYNDVLKYAGRFDALIHLYGKVTLGDHKNSRSRINLSQAAGRRKLWKYMLQCTGYAMAVENQYQVPEIEQGCVFVSNFKTSNADRFVFPINGLLREELMKIVCAYYNPEFCIRESVYYGLDLDEIPINIIN